MNNDTRKFINSLSEDIIELYNIPIPIYDIEAVVNDIGGKINNRNMNENDSDGFIIKEGNTFVISIDPLQDEKRNRFTIAHELGHLFLHMGYKINDQLWAEQDESPYYRNGSSEKEYQANEFAAALLMPKDKYKEVMDKYSNGSKVSTSKIAEYFHVSIDAASNRGKFLGYLQW